MIAKISKSGNLYGALAYNGEKVSEKTAAVLWTNKIANGVNCDMRDALNSFSSRLEKNQRTKNIATHISLNPAPEDKIDDITLIEIAEEYMEKMGYVDQPYIVYKHEDIDRHHLHIVTTDVLENGKRINTSHDHRRSKEITNEIEDKYNLGKADVRNSASLSYKPEKVNHKKPKIGQQIKNVVRHFSEYDFGSINELATTLASYNIDLQQVRGEYEDGSTYAGLLYQATNNAGQKVATPIKASALGKAYGYKKLGAKAFKSKDTVKNKIKSSLTKSILKTEMQRATGLKDLQNRLHKHNIDLVLRESEQGRVYGVTIIDHNEKLIANGSKFGKEFSANAFEKLSQTWDANSYSLPNIGNFADSMPVFENVSGGAIDIAHGRRNEAVDDTDEQKKRKKKKQIVYKI